MWELARSLLALRDPSTAALHVPWVRSLSGRLAGLEIERAIALVPPRGYMPDFLTPPPSGPLGDVEDDLEALRRTPAAQIRTEMQIFASEHRSPPVSQIWLGHPRREVAKLADTLTGYWARALAPAWPRIRAFLDADIAHRARELAQSGPAGLFANLHRDVVWDGDHLDVVSDHTATIPLEGRGLVLIPSAFAWLRPATISEPPWQPTLIYPARGIATLWEDAGAAPEGLAHLLGATRAAVLADLDAPRSTTEIARRLAITAGGASQHLTTLRDAGLVTGRREGRSVLYVRTQLGDLLVAG